MDTKNIQCCIQHLTYNVQDLLKASDIDKALLRTILRIEYDRANNSNLYVRLLDHTVSFLSNFHCVDVY